jgi:hypothetical protein
VALRADARKEPGVAGADRSLGIHMTRLSHKPGVIPATTMRAMVVRPEVVQALLDEARERTGEQWPARVVPQPVPPMEWIEAVRYSAHSHEYLRTKWKRSALSASQP